MAEPKSYRCRFIEPGVISYEDSKQGTVLVSKEALDRMGPSFRNCPVIFIPEQHDNSDKTTAFNFDDIGSNPASGIVTGIPTWGDDGWQYVDVSVWDEDAQKAIENGYSVSCAYFPDEEGDGGEWHQIPYDGEVLNGHYMHMAIVPRPRYEGSRIFANSKKGGNNLPGINLFKAKKNMAQPVAPAPVPKKEPAENGCGPKALTNDDAVMVDVNGTPVPLHELISDYVEKQGSGEPEAVAPETPVALPDGSQVTIADLIASYTGGGEDAAEESETLENAEPPQDTQAAPATDETKQRSNSVPARKPAVNSALKNAARHPAGYEAAEGIDSEAKRLARGSERYSIPVNNKGGK